MTKEPAACTTIRGVCRFCGCTDAHACEGGCWWIDTGHTACSAPDCVEKFFAELDQTLECFVRAMAASGDEA